jgi:hypothetical protein
MTGNGEENKIVQEKEQSVAQKTYSHFLKILTGRNKKFNNIILFT